MKHNISRSFVANRRDLTLSYRHPCSAPYQLSNYAGSNYDKRCGVGPLRMLCRAFTADLSPNPAA